MKTLVVTIDGKEVYSEVILSDVFVGKIMQAKAWAKNRAKGLPYEVEIKKQEKKDDAEISGNLSIPKYIFDVAHAYELRQRGWSIAKIGSKYRKSPHFVMKQFDEYEKTTYL